MFVCQVDGKNGQGRKFREGHLDLEASLLRRRDLSLDGMDNGQSRCRKAEYRCSGHKENPDSI